MQEKEKTKARLVILSIFFITIMMFVVSMMISFCEAARNIILSKVYQIDWQQHSWILNGDDGQTYSWHIKIVQ